MKFDHRARGWTTKSGCATWLEEEFQERAQQDYTDLKHALKKLTKLQLVLFTYQAGRLYPDSWKVHPDLPKSELILHALLAQYQAWYPEIEE